MSPRKRSVYVALLGLGLAAVAVDRLFLLPEKASADPSPEPSPEPSPAEPAEPGVPAASVEPTRVTIADRLDEVAKGLDPADIRDAFELPSAWRSPERGPEPGRYASERFLEAHALTGVMAAEKGGYAIIGGRMIFIGTEIDGFTLVSVGERSAVLVSGPERIVLTLPRPRP